MRSGTRRTGRGRVDASNATAAPRADVRPWGEVDGVPVELATLTAGRVRAVVCSFGATLVSVEVPAGKYDAVGGTRDVVLGLGTLDDGAGGGYVGPHPYLGGTVGRVANRIAGAAFDVGGVRYQLAANDGAHHLHGGVRGFDRLAWSLEVVRATGVASVAMAYVSPDGEEGYPGEVRVRLIVSLSPAGVLSFELRAVADRPTPVALAHHPYFALCGHDRSSVLDHELQLWCGQYLPVDDAGIPTGEVRLVDGTPFDFRRTKAIGRDIDHPDVQGVRRGYDVAYLVDGAPGSLRPGARLADPSSGLSVELHTTQAAIQLYTANDFGAVRGKGGAVYGRHAGVALEAQAPPDAVHHPEFGDVVLKRGRVYRQRTEYRFAGW